MTKYNYKGEEITTIQISKKTRDLLRSLKKYKIEPYEEVILRLIKNYKEKNKILDL